MFEKLLMGRKESNQTKTKHRLYTGFSTRNKTDSTMDTISKLMSGILQWSELVPWSGYVSS